MIWVRLKPGTSSVVFKPGWTASLEWEPLYFIGFNNQWLRDSDELDALLIGCEMPDCEIVEGIGTAEAIRIQQEVT